MNAIVFIVMLVGLLLILNVRMVDFIPSHRKSIKEQVKEASRTKRDGLLVHSYKEARQILLIQGARDPTDQLLVYMTGFAFLGVLTGNAMSNIFLVPILGAVFAVLPFFLIKMRWETQTRTLNDELEAALNAVTTSYMRGNNTLLNAVEENVEQMPASVRRIFKAFLLQANLIDSNLVNALENMKLSVHNSIFTQWINTLIRCQENQTLKSTLPRILDKFSERRGVSGEIQVIMAEPKRTFFIMIGAAAASPFLLYFLNEEWWMVLTTTTGGKAIMAVHMVAIIISLLIGIPAMSPSFDSEDDS